MQTLQIERSDDGKYWIPAHASIKNICFCLATEAEEEARQILMRFIEEIYPGEYTLEYDIEKLRGEVLAKIDLRSDELLHAFEYQGIIFSLSPKAQIRYEFMDRTADTLPYPLPINSLDDRDMVVLTNPADTRAFCGASTNHVFAVVGSGTEEKNKIRAMTTVEELQAYVDPR